MNVLLGPLLAAALAPQDANGGARRFLESLDRDGDGLVSRAEWPGSGAVFLKIDADHDGYLSLAELAHMSDKPAPPAPPPAPDPTDANKIAIPIGPLPDPPELFKQTCLKCHNQDRIERAAKTPDGWRETVTRMQNKKNAKFSDKEAKQILDWLLSVRAPMAKNALRYASNDPRRDWGLVFGSGDLELFDRDRNGKLDVPELADFFVNGLPDVEVFLSFPNGSAAGIVEKVTPGRRGVSVRALRPEMWEIILGDLRLTLDRPYASLLQRQRPQPRDQYRQTITEAFVLAAAGKSYVTTRDLDTAQGRQLRGLFRYADRNGDGQLTMQELAAFLELDFRLADVTFNVSLYSSSSNWFVELDTNHDGRLSRKELQNAWQTLTAGREPTGGLLASPREDDRLKLIFHRGPTTYPTVNQRYLNPTLPPPPTRGPLWFRKMDRNRDGYVSRREFLGAKADFDKLDRNGDGLIDVDEAEAAGKK